MTEAFPSPHAVPPSLKQHSLLKPMSTRLDRDPAGGISACQVFVPCLPLYKVSLGCTVVFSCPCAPESAARRAGVKNSLGVWQGAR